MDNESLALIIIFSVGIFGTYISWQVINIRADVENILKRLKEQNK